MQRRTDNYTSAAFDLYIVFDGVLDDVTAYNATIWIYGNRLDTNHRLRMCDFGADRLGLNIIVTPINV